MNNAINWLKEQKLKGAITGSCLLEYFEGADVDWFAYGEESFTQMFYAMYYNPMFHILDPLEKWKADKFMSSPSNKMFHGVQTIKFIWNTCLPVNIVLKKNCHNAFSVIASFDLSIICKAYDTYLGKELDLTDGTDKTKIATFNKWNTAFYNSELWEISRILRQLERVIKYHKRGFNTDAVVVKYIELIEEVQKYQSIFDSDSFNETLKIRKRNTKVVKQICEVWLKTHEMSEEQLELLKEKIKEI